MTEFVKLRQTIERGGAAVLPVQSMYPPKSRPKSKP